MKLPILPTTLLLSASPAIAENTLERKPEPLAKINPRLAQSHSGETVFVLLYNPGTDQEGIHALEHGKAAPEILIFESEEDALIYSRKLEELSLPSPTIVAYSRVKIERFIVDNNYRRLYVESGRGIDAPIGEESGLHLDHNY